MLSVSASSCLVAMATGHDTLFARPPMLSAFPQQHPHAINSCVGLHLTIPVQQHLRAIDNMLAVQHVAGPHQRAHGYAWSQAGVRPELHAHVADDLSSLREALTAHVYLGEWPRQCAYVLPHSHIPRTPMSTPRTLNGLRSNPAS
ncbi:hypothetical protein EWM64_g8572 [Hericium alpestre]|uniref:Uncharacterized protein n=1 Tax=Hericium alpestre TaxID=135208 RepID=A0A4Y9ZPS8_9AGAM|nr:hypothetical protein EWM64_g8572 [Hericium alpestre]